MNKQLTYLNGYAPKLNLEEVKQKIRNWISDNACYEVGDNFYVPNIKEFNIINLDELGLLVDRLQEIKGSGFNEENIIKLLRSDGRIYNYVNFNLSDKEAELFNRNLESSSENNFDEYSKSAIEEAEALRQKITDDAESAARELFELLEIMLEN